jgi:hypothetical protein
MTAGIVVLLSYTLLAVAQPAATPPLELRLPEKALAEEKYTFVTSTAKFPADLRDALARQLSQKSLSMADADQPFGASDAITEPRLPGHRLMMAALGAEYSVIHFERGGIALTRWAAIFQRTPKGFNVLWHGAISQTFRERATFERAIREGTLWKPPARPTP